MVHKILKNPQAVIGLALIVLICAVALLAPILAPNDPNAVNPLLKYQPAAPSFLWGPINWDAVNSPAFCTEPGRPLALPSRY